MRETLRLYALAFNTALQAKFEYRVDFFLGVVTSCMLQLAALAFLFVVSWNTLNNIEAVSAQPDHKIRAIAGQFQWTFEYLPDDWEPQSASNPDPPAPLYTEYVPVRPEGSQDGGMAVPAGESVKLYLDSPDVIHAFYVPQFLFKRDVVPGRTNIFQFDVDARGDEQSIRVHLVPRRDEVRRVFRTLDLEFARPPRFISRLSLADAVGDRVDIAFENVQLNATIPDSTFAITERQP